ncbi:hypothetical protein Golob_002934, partial [Gossypium lobatum]|nr:hypothetical protein [Gossypium lobatum]
MTVGKSKNFQTKARAIYEGFSIAWKEGFRHIELESNNTILIDIISNSYAWDDLSTLYLRKAG